MSDAGAGSWQPDPYGRFAQRYWDGVQWTASVSDGRGGQFNDPPVPNAPGTTAPYSTPAAAAKTGVPTVALAIVGVGALLLILSDFVLAWFSSSGSDFNLSDLRDAASETSDLSFLPDAYLNWGWIVGLAAVGLAVGALFQPKLRVVAAAVLFAVAAWHGWTAYDISTEEVSPEFGAWLGSIGLIVCGAAALLPTTAFLSSQRT